MPKEYHNVTPAAYLVLQKDNKVLLLRRFNTDYEDGNYSFIAGHVNKAESFTETIIREAREEAGIEIKPEDLTVVHVLHRKEPDHERMDIFFTAKKWYGTIENKEPHKCDDLNWYSLDNLPNNLIPYIKYAIECIKKGVIYSEFGWH